MSIPTVAGFWPQTPITPSPGAYHSVPTSRVRSPRAPAWNLGTSRKGGRFGTEATPVTSPNGDIRSRRDPAPAPNFGRSNGTGSNSVRSHYSPKFSFGNNAPTRRQEELHAPPPWTPGAIFTASPWLGGAAAKYGSTRSPRLTQAALPQLTTRHVIGSLVTYRESVAAADLLLPARPPHASHPLTSPVGPRARARVQLSRSHGGSQTHSDSMSSWVSSAEAPPDSPAAAHAVALYRVSWLLEHPDERIDMLRALYASVAREATLTLPEVQKAVHILCQDLCMRQPPMERLEALYHASRSKWSGSDEATALTPARGLGLDEFSLLVAFLLSAAKSQLENENGLVAAEEGEEATPLAAVAAEGTLRMWVLDSRRLRMLLRVCCTRCGAEDERTGSFHMLKSPTVMQCQQCGVRSVCDVAGNAV